METTRPHRRSIAGVLLAGSMGACIGSPPIPPPEIETDDGTTATTDGSSGSDGADVTGVTDDTTTSDSSGSSSDSTTGASGPCEGADGLCHEPQPAILLEGGLAPIRAADMNGDGALDVIVGTYGSVFVVLSNGT